MTGSDATMMALLVDCGCELGEAPLWHPLRGELLFVDIAGRALHAVAGDGSRARRWDFDVPVSALGWIDHDRMMVVTALGFVEIDLETDRRTAHAALEADDPRTRSNDGRVDPFGGFWVGTMGLGGERDMGALYRLSGRDITTLRRPMSIPNACCFTGDGRIGYSGDSLTGIIHRWPIDPATGLPAGAPEVFVDLSGTGTEPGGAAPDGAVVDAEDHVWCALWNGGRVVRYRPDGTEERSIALPVSRPTCPAFGGPDLKTLYVTSAWQGFTPAQRAAEPLAGGVFAIRVDTPGLAEPAFRMTGTMSHS